MLVERDRDKRFDRPPYNGVYFGVESADDGVRPPFGRFVVGSTPIVSGPHERPVDGLFFAHNTRSTAYFPIRADSKPRSELLGRTVREILTEEIGLRLLQIIGLVLETGRPETWEYRLEVPAGLRWFQIRLAPIAAEGTSRRVCLLVRDITDQKDAEQEISRLLSHEQLLTRLSEALPIGLFEIDMAGLVRFTNDRMRPIVGDLPAATLEGLRSSVIAEDRPVLEAALATAYGGHPIDDVEVRLCLRAPGTPMTSGSTRAFSLSLRPLGDPVGVITGVVGCLSDVTERVQLRRELEVMASVDKLTSCLNREASLKLLERITGMPPARTARETPSSSSTSIISSRSTTDSATRPVTGS